MNLYPNITFILPIIFIVFGIILLGTGIIVYFKSNADCDKETVAVLMVAFGIVITIISTIWLFTNLYNAKIQRDQEQLYFQSNVEFQETLQKAINNSKDIVNTDLYLKAANFNADLAKLQAAQNDPRYSWSFSGDVDWSTIPFINLD